MVAEGGERRPRRSGDDDSNPPVRASDSRPRSSFPTPPTLTSSGARPRAQQSAPPTGSCRRCNSKLMALSRDVRQRASRARVTDSMPTPTAHAQPPVFEPPLPHLTLLAAVVTSGHCARAIDRHPPSAAVTSDSFPLPHAVPGIRHASWHCLLRESPGDLSIILSSPTLRADAWRLTAGIVACDLLQEGCI